MNKLLAGNDIIPDIIKEYSDMLIRIAYQNVKSMHDAEDIVQEVYIKLIKNIKSIKDEKHLKAWLIRVTINRCKDYHKSSWIKKIVPIESDISYNEPEKDEIMKEILMLKPDYRMVIYLYYYEEYSLAEIAEILGKSINTISTRLRRARSKLKLFIEKEGEQDGCKRI
ncbi:MAG: sigma-70 family RNA polymerase sigma factor [Clostridia bacterium]|nr:sigma-70 family RNA polymerase sigma factor [Clostridia bacterium]